MKNKGLEPAFPLKTKIDVKLNDYVVDYSDITTGGRLIQLKELIDFEHPGMSKRFYAACAAMQGLLSNPYPDIIWLDNKVICEMAYMFADKLLTQEEDGQED